MASRETVSLYHRSGTSDKVYHVQLEETSLGKWSVTAQNGRRIGSLTARVKVLSTSWSAAKKVYDDLVDEKLAGRYTRGALAGPSAAPGPTLPANPAPAAVKLPPMPAWPDLEMAYAEVATFFGEPATFKTSPQAWMVLMVDMAASAQEGLVDAVKQVKRCKSDNDVLKLLSDDGRAWFALLTGALQSASVTLMRGSAAAIKKT